MDFIRNFPFFSIVLAMFAGIISSAMTGHQAKRVCITMVSVVLVMSACVLYYTSVLGDSVTYLMGHFPAPWGNEIRFGVLEGLLALFFAMIMLLSILGGLPHIFVEIEESKINLFFVLIDLMMASLLALIYTNDLFTGYVFVEINTISACGMIMCKQNGHGIVAAIRYMVMSLIGSGLFLISICILYGITGQLLMVPAHEAIEQLIASGNYMIPLTVLIGLMSVGLGIKSGLYPFHTWIPDTYGYATPTASAILSSLVSKGYIILLIKIYFRVIGFDAIAYSKVINPLFVFGFVAMVMGSVHALTQKDMRRMIAYSSVAQIGYIYLGIGLGTTAGIVGAIFHVFTHAATKSLLFISAAGLYESSDGKTDFYSLRGSGYRNPLAGLAFSVGALSMVGFPMLPGFITKLLLANAAFENRGKMFLTFIALIVSTILNAGYFLRAVVFIYSSRVKDEEAEHVGHYGQERAAYHTRWEKIALVIFIVLNLFMGMYSGVIVNWIETGLAMFS